MEQNLLAFLERHVPKVICARHRFTMTYMVVGAHRKTPVAQILGKARIALHVLGHTVDKLHQTTRT